MAPARWSAAAAVLRGVLKTIADQDGCGRHWGCIGPCIPLTSVVAPSPLWRCPGAAPAVATAEGAGV
jgi:hypothetical protein